MIRRTSYSLQFIVCTLFFLLYTVFCYAQEIVSSAELIETPKGKEATNITILPDTPVSEPLEAESPKAATPEIGEIKGVGKATEEKLRMAGFDTVESIASTDADNASEKTGLSSKVTAKIIASAKELLE